MSIQRWTHYSDGMAVHYEGEYVTYADHLAAVADAEQRVREEREANGPVSKRAFAEGVQAASDAVVGIKSDPWGQGRILKAVALRAIDGVKP